MTTLRSYFDDSSCLLVLVSVADLVGGVAEAIAPALEEKFSIFFQQRGLKNEFMLPQIHLKTCFLPMIAPPFEKSQPPSKILDPPVINVWCF